MSTYIGLTIGPIYKTLSRAKKTGELWGSSYIFSWIMKKICYELYKSGKVILTPFSVDEELYKQRTDGAGLFHDRIIFKADQTDFNNMERIIMGVLEALSEDISGTIKEDKNAVLDFIRSYFRLYYVKLEIPQSDNILITVNKALDNLELMVKSDKPVEDNKNYLRKFLLNDNIKQSKLFKDGFGPNNKKYKSIPEICLGKEFDENIEDDECFEGIKEKYKKYIAIVRSDGDNMGAIINTLKSDKEYAEFSKKLFELAKESVEIIKKYGGTVLYAGGDDLLFLAPVIKVNDHKNNNGENIFDLINKIDSKFEVIFNDEINKLKKKPSLSYGVSISYYKYPLAEALEKSSKLLFEKAKTGVKNNISFEVLKHSGQVFGGLLHKKDVAYTKFTNLLTQSKVSGELLKSVLYKIHNDKPVISSIADNADRLKAYFDNNFNESIHADKKDYFDKVADYIKTLKDNCKDESYYDTLYGTVKFIKFLKEEGE